MLRNLFCLAFTLLFPTIIFGHPLKAKVIGVADGDTLTVLQSKTPLRIRLYGIDCPEDGQDFSSKAKQFLAELVFNEEVSLELKGADSYGRIVANVSGAAGEAINELMVSEGLCWWSEKYAPAEKQLAELQAEAKAKKLGVWSRSDAVPPWEYRSGSAAQLTAELRQQAASSGQVVFNTKSLKYHSPGCRGAISCTKNCVSIGKTEALKRGGVPCKMCGG